METPTIRRLQTARWPALLITVTSATLVLGACSSGPLTLGLWQAQQPLLPEPIRVPAGYKPVLEAKGKGLLVFECQAVKLSAAEYAWLPRNPSVGLLDSANDAIVLTRNARSWVHRDGSEMKVREFIEVPNGSHNLPLQRATAEPSSRPGALYNVSYIQRLKTVGGLPIKSCGSPELGMQVSVPYEADYVFWRPLTP